MADKLKKSKSALKKVGFAGMFFVAGFTSAKSDLSIPELPLFADSSSSKMHFDVKDRTSFPMNSCTIQRPCYALNYDYRTKNSLWVYERLTADNLIGNTDRSHFQFKEDLAVPAIFRSTSDDYTNSGFDRGHLAPAADHKKSPESMKDTFFMSNISPQNPQFNRGYWAKLEKYVRDLTKSNRTVEVITGHLFLPEEVNGKKWVKYQVIGKNDVSVPTHFFKVIRIEGKNGSVETQAYILPNKEINIGTPLDSFKTTIHQVEKAAGIIFTQTQKKGSI